MLSYFSQFQSYKISNPGKQYFDNVKKKTKIFLKLFPQNKKKLLLNISLKLLHI